MWKKFFYTHQDGRVVSRASQNKYTHVVVARYDLDFERALAQSAEYVASYKRQWLILTGHHVTATPAIEEFGTEDDYVASRIKTEFDRIAAKGDAEFVLAWTESWEMARRLAHPRPWLRDIGIMSVDRAREPLRVAAPRGAFNWGVQA
jgi:hypothetical protein